MSENYGVWMIVNDNAEFNRKYIVAVKLNQARIRCVDVTVAELTVPSVCQSRSRKRQRAWSGGGRPGQPICLGFMILRFGRD